MVAQDEFRAMGLQHFIHNFSIDIKGPYYEYHGES